ncbi:MAG: winged helix-turn-helix domain-containing protein [Anaerolineae bacterium]|nr:winged helix-turn-helix domain-containing protein [Anaerolineae bacterium]
MSPHTRLTRYRSHDVLAILEFLANGQPVTVVGLSNFGKSTLLRQMIVPSVAASYQGMTGRSALFVYVDCNRMLEMSAQGFYEAILRAVMEALDADPADHAALRQRIAGFYQGVVESKSAFAIPLAFNDGLLAMLEDPHSQQDTILLLDEFDAVLTGLDERVFLNLRALKDRYGDQLNFVTATLKPLSMIGGGDELGEFLEVFAPYKHNLKPLNTEDATELAAEIFEQANDSLDPHERDYILVQAGGHPGLVQAVSHVVLEVESGVPSTYTEQALSVAGDVLQNHRLVRSELLKLWRQLLPAEREAVMLAATRGSGALSELQRIDLRARGLLLPDGHLFSQLFAAYARRQGLSQQNAPDGVWVDIDAGTVWVSGGMVEPLTDLEYRLLLLLYGRLDKICDKYQIVEAVWGQEYLGEVDDARIEKLISRLRAKLEPDPSHPRFIITVRGRGYKLNSRPNGISRDAS